MRHLNHKYKQARRQVPQHIQLYNSSAQDQDREGSHLAHMSQGTWITIGIMIEKDLKESDCNKYDLRNVPILDIGGGHCSGLASFKAFFKCYAVAVEASHETWKGSILFQKYLLDKSPSELPFIPIHGNAKSLDNFGGARLVYCWLKGANEELIHHLFDLFVEDSWAMYFIANGNYEKHAAVVKGKVIKLDFLDGNFAFSNRKMRLFIYRKKSLCFTTRHIKMNKNQNGLSFQIMNSIKVYKNIYNLSKEKKRIAISKLFKKN